MARPRRRRRATPPRWSPWLPAAVGVALVVTVGLWWAGDRLLPGTRVAGIPVGGLSTGRAEAALETAWRTRPIVVLAGADTWSATAEDLGLVLDAGASAAAARAAGRDPGAWWRRLTRRVPLEVAPTWRLDGARAGAFLSDLAPRVAIAPQSAGIQVRNGQVSTSPAADGRMLDQAATLVALQGQAEAVVASQRLDLVTRPVPAAVRDVSQAVQAAEALLARALTVRAWDPVRNEELAWELPPATWGPWLQLADLSADGTRPTWAVDGPAVTAWLGTLGDRLGPERYLKADEGAAYVRDTLNGQPNVRRLRMYHHATTHQVEAGETIASIGARFGIPYPWVQQANPGLGDNLRVGQEIAIPSPDDLLPLPVVENKRVVVGLAEQKVRVYENGQEKWVWPISTGIASSPTAPGVFQVQSHDEEAYASNWDLNMPKFLGIYRPIPSSPFMNGFHGFPSRGNRQILWTNNLGHPVTYGCILLGTEASQQLYDWAENGTIVEVRP
jgi:lipoprotein-anchoring transpeptidase ErfK/SrfK